MRIVAVQPDITWQNPASTFDHIRGLLAHADIQRGSLIVLPEMFATGFSMNVSVIAEGDAKPSEAFMKEIAARYDSTVVGGVVTQNTTGKGLNQALVINAESSERARYSKIHPFTFGSEPDHFDAGSQIKTFNLDSGIVYMWTGPDGPPDTWTIAPLVCYDLRFPELFRIASGKGKGMGAHMLLVIANWPASRIDHWTALLRARAIENQAYVVGVNRTGKDPNVAYNGQSVIFNPKGHAIAQAEDEPCVIQADADLAELVAYRKKFSALHDMKYQWSDEAFDASPSDESDESDGS